MGSGAGSSCQASGCGPGRCVSFDLMLRDDEVSFPSGQCGLTVHGWDEAFHEQGRQLAGRGRRRPAGCLPRPCLASQPQVSLTETPCARLRAGVTAAALGQCEDGRTPGVGTGTHSGWREGVTNTGAHEQQSCHRARAPALPVPPAARGQTHGKGGCGSASPGPSPRPHGGQAAKPGFKSRSRSQSQLEPLSGSFPSAPDPDHHAPTPGTNPDQPLCSARAAWGSSGPAPTSLDTGQTGSLWLASPSAIKHCTG